MKKKNCKKLIGLLIVLTFVTGFVGCRRNGGDSLSVDSSISNNPIEEGSGLTIDYSALAIDIYSQMQLNVINAKGDVTWTSTNTSVASVTNDGVVLALAVGNAVIIATDGKDTVSCRVTVRNQGIVPVLEFYNEEVVIVEGTSLSIGARVTLKAETLNCEITYVSKNEAVALVNEEGIVTGISAGETVVTVTAKVNANLTLTDSILVTVRNINEI